MSKIVIIGYGKMGKFYDKAISADIIVDIIPIPNRTYFKSLDEFLFDHPVVDLVIVSTPSETHFPITKSLLENNYNVLVEKPICLSVTETLILEKLAKKQGMILYQSTLERYNPVTSFIKKNIDFSLVSRVKSTRFGIQPNRVNQEGPVLDLGIHEVDLYVYLAAGKVPWGIEVGYSESPKREIIIYLESGEKVICDLLNKQISKGNINLDFKLSNQNNPMVQMIQEILYKGPSINETWSKEVAILEKFINNKIQL